MISVPPVLFPAVRSQHGRLSGSLGPCPRAPQDHVAHKHPGTAAASRRDHTLASLASGARARPRAASTAPRGRAVIMPIFLVLDEDAQRSAVEIVELTMAKRPEESGEAQKAKPEGDWYQDEDPVHRSALLTARIATTISDEPDIAMAAISGVTSPRKASGTATNCSKWRARNSAGRSLACAAPCGSYRPRHQPVTEEMQSAASCRHRSPNPVPSRRGRGQRGPSLRPSPIIKPCGRALPVVRSPPACLAGSCLSARSSRVRVRPARPPRRGRPTASS